MSDRLTFSGMLLALVLIVPATSHAGFLDDLMQRVGTSEAPGAGLDDSTIVKGLKEALTTGTGRAIASVSKKDGYFGNEMIKIVIPENLQAAADLISTFGFRQEVDDVVLGMNRAAEKAAPKAMEHFISALKAMTFDDARAILQGDKTSATDYFRQKTGSDIHTAFKPIISSSLQEVGAVKTYKQMMGRFNSITFGGGGMTAFDLDTYVTDKAVAGLFSMLGEEEKKIRTDPAARGTEVLRKVFGK